MEDQEVTAASHPNAEAVGHLYAAKVEFIGLQAAAGRSPEGRYYSILLTDLEKLIHVEAGYFPRRAALPAVHLTRRRT